MIHFVTMKDSFMIDRDPHGAAIHKGCFIACIKSDPKNYEKFIEGFYEWLDH